MKKLTEASPGGIWTRHILNTEALQLLKTASLD
jgi:hypothetical protein